MIFSLVRRNVLLWAALVEGGMLVSALAVGWLVGFSPLRTFLGKSLSEDLLAAGEGLAAGTLLVVAGVVIANLPWDVIRRFDDFMGRQVVPLFAESSWLELALISLLAGCGEEVLFRGLLQDGLKHWLGGPNGWLWALGIASVLFGVCHALNWTYLILATLMGLAFGLMLQVFDNLVVCIVAHAWYDFVLLVYLVRRQEK